MDLKRRLVKHTPTILSVIASLGVVGTAVLTARATVKAVDTMYEEECETKKETVKKTWKYYILPTIAGVSTITCIMSANMLSRKQQAALISAYGLLRSAYDEYQRKIRDIYGSEGHEMIMDEIIKERCDPDSVIHTQDFNLNLDFDTVDSEIVRTFYDMFSDRYFETTVSKVLQAEYHLNRNFVLNGYTNVNEFYRFLGLPELQEKNLWWEIGDDYMWIDFNHHVTTLDDGMEVCNIEMFYKPQLTSS